MRSLPAFHDHPYPATIYFVPTESAWNALMRRMRLSEPYPQSAGHCTTFTHPGRNDVITITLSPDADTRSSTQVIGLMAHELMHVIQALQTTAKARFDPETEAYLLQAMLQWLIHAYADAGRSYADNPFQALQDPTA